MWFQDSEIFFLLKAYTGSNIVALEYLFFLKTE